MNYLKYTQFVQYVYLVFSAFFVYNGVKEMNAGETPYISFGIAAVALFMFFFRRRFAKRLENRDKNS